MAKKYFTISGASLPVHLKVATIEGGAVDVIEFLESEYNAEFVQVVVSASVTPFFILKTKDANPPSPDVTNKNANQSCWSKFINYLKVTIWKI